VAQAVSCQSLNTEAWIQSKASLCWVYGQSGTVTGFSQSTPALHRQYHPINAPKSYNSSTTSAKLSHWQGHCIKHFPPSLIFLLRYYAPFPTHVPPCNPLQSTSESVHMNVCRNKTSLGTRVSAWVAPRAHRTESKNNTFSHEVYTALSHNKLHAFTKLQKATINYVCMYVCLPACTEELGSHWTDFYEIWYLMSCWKSVMKIQVSLKSDKNNRYLTWRYMYICGNISQSSFWNDKWFK
jgi:hypothetical protein